MMPSRAPAKIDWGLLERTLLRLAKSDLRQFAGKHPNETFYGFAFDCNSEYGEVGLCANTNELLKKMREAPDPNAALWASLNKKLGLSNESPAGGGRMSRWSLGDWGYQGFNSKAFNRDWRRLQSIVTKRCMEEEQDPHTFMTPTQTRFMEAACRVLLRLERDSAFDVLRRTRNFSTLAMDHDEPEAAARQRLRRIQRQERGENPNAATARPKERSVRANSVKTSETRSRRSEEFIALRSPA
jgi:hypothetical protein